MPTTAAVRTAAPRFRCQACSKDFAITSGTLFASHKLPLRGYLAAIAIFCNEVKGKSMLALSRDLGLSYKSAFVLAHKLREAMAEEMKGRQIGDDRPEAEVDGAYFGGYVKPANLAEDRVDRRLRKQPDRQAQGRRRDPRARRRDAAGRVQVGEARRCLGSSSRVAKGTVLHADEAPVMERSARALRDEADQPPGGLQPRRRLHQLGRELLRRMRRGETGPPSPHRRPVPAPLRARGGWREDNRRVPNGEQVQRVASWRWGASSQWISAATGSGISRMKD